MGIRRSFRYWLYQLTIFLIFVFALICIFWNARDILNARRLNLIADSYSSAVVFSPTHSQIRPGDRIISVNGIGVESLERTFGISPTGEEETAVIRMTRGERPLSVTVPLQKPTYWLLRLSMWWLIITAFLFLFSGILYQYFHAPNDQNLAFIYVITSTCIALLVTGMFTDGTLASDLSLYTVWFLFPSVAYLQYLIVRVQATSKINLAINLSYLVAFIGYILSVLSANPFLMDGHPVWETITDLTGRLLIPLWAISWSILIIWLIITRYQKMADKQSKRVIGLIAAGSLFSFSPALILTLIPGTLFDSAILPFELTFMMLIVAPISYGYAIRQYRYVKLERYVSRAGTAFLTLLITSIFYVSLTYLIQSTIDQEEHNLIVTILTVLLPALAFEPIRRNIQQWFDRITYGGWYDFESVISQVSAQLSVAPSIHQFANALSATVQSAMRVSWAGVLIQQPDSHILEPATIVGNKEVAKQFQNVYLRSDLEPMNQLMKSKVPILHDELAKKFQEQKENPTQNVLLSLKKIRLFLPIKAGTYHALLLLGPKYSREPYSNRDIAILRVIARQASITLAHAILLDELKRKIAENEQYQRQIINTREEEGKRIAREIHDSLIQSLVAFKYQLVDVQSNLDLHPTSVKMNLGISRLQDQLGTLIQEARHICQELRPETIDLGLIPSLRSTLHQFEEDENIEIQFRIEGDIFEPQEDIVICLLRCLQEALHNIQKHAQATRVNVELRQNDNKLQLFIEDNGRGFEVPKRLGALMDDYHFGVIGMRERVELLKGTFQLKSEPQKGACITIELPLDQAALIKAKLPLSL